MTKRLTILLLLISNVCFAQKTVQLDSLFSKLHNTHQFNGNVLIAENGKILFEKSYGLSDFETKEPLNSNTLFGLASVSKQFTAMGILLLQKDGKLKFSDPISKYLPELTFYGTITIQNLIHHTSGLPDYMKLFDEHWDKSKFATNKDIVNLLKQYKPKLHFKPGEEFEYSNTGYALLALIIEKVSGKSYGDFLKQKIFIPLSMNRTMVYRSRFNPQEIQNRAKGYFVDSLNHSVSVNSLGKDVIFYYLDGIVGDGMVNSTTEDLLKWDNALRTNKLITNNERQLIFSGVKTSNGESTDYGFGWFVTHKKEFGKIVYHSGGWAGYVTYNEIDLDSNKTIIILQNIRPNSSSIPIREIRHILYNIISIYLKPSYLKKLVGTYKVKKGDDFSIVFKDGKLYMPMGKEIKLELYPKSKTKFKLIGYSPDVFVNFTIRENKIIECELLQPKQNVKIIGIKKQ